MTKLRLCLSASYGILTFLSRAASRDAADASIHKRVGDRLARPWMQELLWVRRDDNGEIVRVSQDPPKEGDFIPTVPSVKRVNSKPNKKK
jgi:hypothetical protein